MLMVKSKEILALRILNYFYIFYHTIFKTTGSNTKNLAPQAIPIFLPDGDRVEINEPMKNLDDTEKENKPALAINCEMTENGKNIKKLLESVVKTPLKYVR